MCHKIALWKNSPHKGLWKFMEIAVRAKEMADIH